MKRTPKTELNLHFHNQETNTTVTEQCIFLKFQFKNMYIYIYIKVFINIGKSQRTALLIRRYPQGMSLPDVIKIEGKKIVFNSSKVTKKQTCYFQNYSLSIFAKDKREQSCPNLFSPLCKILFSQPKSSPPRYTIVKLSKIKDKERTLKAAKEKKKKNPSYTRKIP